MKYELDKDYMRGPEIEPIKKGNQYEEAIEATKDLNISAGIWYFIGGLGDRFSPTQTADNLTIAEAIEFCYRIGVKKISFHYPGEYTDENCDAIDEMLRERGMSIASIAANVFTSLVFKYGGPSCHIREVRNLARKLKQRAQQLCAEHGCHHQTDWAGRDGFDGYLLYEPEKQWEWTKENYVRMLECVEGKSGIAIEFKPYDAMEHSVLKNVDCALLMAVEVEEEIANRIKRKLKAEGKTGKRFDEEFKKRFKPYDHSVGVNIEDAHVYMAGQKVSEAVRKSIAAKRLFLRHENDCEGRIDNDRIFGSIHFWDALEATYVQVINKYDERGGWHEPDLFPQRDDQLKAYIQSINAINYFYALARRLAYERKWARRLERVIESKKSSEANALLFDLVSEGVEYKKIPLKLADIYRKEIKKPMSM